ncbi:SUMF1/EgtB/PvdO family nonheme iron enzyme, partial [Opitutales bacterium]|nr:SUMF1/EgtB/PvdO family nonheme iron enzyme [Opitutales bacterium]
DANLSSGNFTGLNFGWANLTGADLTDANFTLAWFNSSTVWPEGFDFLNSGAWGPGVDFSDQYLQLKALGKDLAGANLSGTSFTWDSEFDSTSLKNADLTEGNFSGLNFSSSNLSGAKLDGANFTGATFNQDTNFTGAMYNSATIWPDGFDPVAAGAIIPKPFLLSNEELDLIALDQFMHMQRARYVKSDHGEVDYNETNWDVSRDRRADKYLTFDGVVQSYSPMSYSETNMDDPNGYNDLLHSSIQGPFADLVHDERTLSTQMKSDENISISGHTYLTKVYEIKEVLGFQGLVYNEYHEERTRILWVHESLGLLRWTESNQLSSESNGLGSVSNPHIDESLEYSLILQTDSHSPTHTVDLNSTIALEMIWVEPGTFTMGSPGTEEGRNNNETEHNVTLTEGFYLGKYEVTQAQYEAVMTGNTNGLSATPSRFSGNPNRPVEKVSWDDIQVYLKHLNEQNADNIPAGWAYVLPTEEEWEYACRAGTDTAYSWGDSITLQNANYYEDSLSYHDQSTKDVGQYLPNAWGFYDMHGNVIEWTNGLSMVGPEQDPTLIVPVEQRIYRGGAFNSGKQSLRSAYRIDQFPSVSGHQIGFRLAFKQTNRAPAALDSIVALIITENQPIGTIVGEFNATDPDAGILTYHFVSGENNNSLFNLDLNGTLSSATVFDFESNASVYTVRIKAMNEFNATEEKQFPVTLLDLDDEKPVIVLNGDGNVTHEAGSLYQDANASWSDNVDGAGTVVGVGEVNASLPGIYTILYRFTDSSGNQA